MNIKLQSIESTQIHSAGYDPTTQVLALKFHPRGKDTEGATYTYAKVPLQTYAEFQAAPSKGKFFGANIKGKFQHTKVTK